jgi:hypothetical protein
MKFFYFFLLLWVLFALDPDPDSESGSTDPIESGSNTVEEGNTEHLSAFNIILKILRNISSLIFFHRRAYEKFYFRYQ